MFNHGIVAGGFRPLHKGHEHLINTALRLCERVTILVVYKFGEIDGNIRYQWVKQAFPTAHVIKTCDLVTDDSTRESNKQWARYTRELLEGDMPDAVFSSEAYAVGWANEMGAEHVMVDASRAMYAISGTKIRNDPYAYFNLIHPVARPYYTKKVLLIGAESTGKTTLTLRLAQLYETRFVPEYGRIYVERHGINEDVKREIFPLIVNKQQEMEDEFIKDANRILFCDTDLLTTSLWYEVWQPQNAGDALDSTIYDQGIMRRNSYDLVLLMDYQGTEWKDDGFRDQANTRKWFTDELKELHLGCHLLSGSWEEREAAAIRLTNRLLQPTEAVLPR
jgi:HTH-type transcriptional repressor of NAD biosynthesis genes